MIKGPRKERDIRDRISDSTIYRYYAGDFVIGRKKCSPLRADRNPSFVIKVGSNGRLYHCDYGDDRFRGNSVEFVMQRFNEGYKEAVNRIERDLGYGHFTAYQSPAIVGEDEKVRTGLATLQCVVRKKFTDEELEYWNQWDIDEETLRLEHIYPVKEIWKNRERFPRGEDLCFGYLTEQKYWQFYWPQRDKKALKWLGNVPRSSLMDGIENITPGTDLAIVTKSKKDYLIWRKYHKAVCWTRNEGVGYFSKQSVDILRSNAKRIFIAYDGDGSGIKATEHVIEKFPDFYPLWHSSYYPRTDYAEWYKEDKQSLETFLKQNLYETIH